MLASHPVAASFAVHYRVYYLKVPFLPLPVCVVTDRNELEAAQKFLEQAAIENLVSFAPPDRSYVLSGAAHFICLPLSLTHTALM